MSRKATGCLVWRGTPLRPWAKITVLKPGGGTKRVPIDLERPDLRQDRPEDVEEAWALVHRYAKRYSGKLWVGKNGAPTTDPFIRDLEKPWLKVLASRPRDGAIGMDMSVVRRYILPKLGRFRAATGLTTTVLVNFFEEVARKPSVGRKRNPRPPSAGYVRSMAKILTQFIEDIRRHCGVVMPSNPMDNRDVHRALRQIAPLPKNRPVVLWDRPGLEAVLAMPWDDIWFGLALVASETGLRDGELHGPTFAHLKVEAGEPIPYLAVAQQVAKARLGKPAMVARNAITGEPVLKNEWSFRDVPLRPESVAWFRWWKTEGWRARVGRDPTDADFVFPDSEGKPWRQSPAEKLQRMLKANGLPVFFTAQGGRKVAFTWHAFRRTLSRMLKDLKVPQHVREGLFGWRPERLEDENYSPATLQEKAEALAQIALTLPTRNGLDGLLNRPTKRPPPRTRAGSRTSQRTVITQ